MKKETYYRDKQSGKILTEAEMLDSVDDDDQLDSFYIVDIDELNNPKILYCTIIECDEFEGPLVFHTLAAHSERATQRAMEEMVELGWDKSDFEIYTFEVNKNDIVEK